MKKFQREKEINGLKMYLDMKNFQDKLLMWVQKEKLYKTDDHN